jgi:gamma-glutamylputrescine oxidase
VIRYPESYYAAKLPSHQERPQLIGRRSTEVAIIGAGFTGISAALHLAERGASTIVVEAARVGYQASGRNGGQIHSGYNIEQGDLEREFGRERAHALWDIAEAAKRLVRERIRRHAIACSLHDGILIAAHDRAAARDLLQKVRHLNEHYGYASARFLGAAGTEARIGSRIYHGALADSGGGHLDPLAFVLGLAAAAESSGATIHEETRAIRVTPRGDGVLIECEMGEIAAQKAILACDAFMPEIAPALSRYLANIESYAIALGLVDAPEILPRNEAVADTRRALDYYKMTDDRRLIFAGGETTLSKTRHVARIVRPRLDRVFFQLAHLPITQGWSGTVAITRRRLPHFGRLAPNILFGYGYSGQGVALGTYGGKVLADAAMGDESEFAVLASIPPKPYPFGRTLRQPLTAAMVLGLKIADAW